MKDISRFTRADAEESYQVYMDLLNSGISLIFLDNPTVSSDYIKKMMGIAEEQSIVTRTALQGTIKLLLIVELDRVETERKTIVKRIKDGIQALQAIKQLNPQAKVIMCSAMGQQAMVIEAIQSGAKDFIVKPFQAERVLEAVKKVVG